MMENFRQLTMTDLVDRLRHAGNIWFKNSDLLLLEELIRRANTLLSNQGEKVEKMNDTPSVTGQSFPQFPQFHPRAEAPPAQSEQIQPPFQPQAGQRKRGRPATRAKAKNGGQRGRPRKKQQEPVTVAPMSMSNWPVEPASPANALHALDSVLRALQPLPLEDRNTVLSLINRFNYA